MSHPIVECIKNMLAKGVLSLIDSSKKMQTAQIMMLADETADLPYFEQYGFTSRPNPGAEAVASFYDGDRSHGVILCIADRRYRLTGLSSGEVAVYDDTGQSIVLKKSGVVINGGGKPVMLTNTSEVTLDTPLARFTGNIVAAGEIADQGGQKSMSGMRSTYNHHTHDETQAVTSTPKQSM